jgi:hypothetical protein
VKIDLAEQFPSIFMFINRKRKLVLGAAITLGVLAVTALALPSESPKFAAALTVAPGYLAVPVKIHDAAIVSLLTTDDRVDVIATRQIGDELPTVRQLANNVRVLTTLEADQVRLSNGRESSTVIIEASPTAALAIAGAINDAISLAVLPK